MNLLLILAASVTLAWDHAQEPDVTSYNVYVGIQTLIGGNPPVAKYVSLEKEFTVNGLDYGTKYYFAVTAVKDALKLESGFSNEVSHTPVPPASVMQLPIVNPSFDANLQDTQTPAGWLEWNGAGSYTEVFGGNRSGPRHLTHYHPNTYQTYTYQVLTNVPSGTYKVEAWGRSTGGQKATGIAFKGAGVNGNVWIPIPVASTYQKVSGTITVTGGRLEIGFWSDSPGSKWTYFDDISVFK